MHFSSYRSFLIVVTAVGTFWEVKIVGLSAMGAGLLGQILGLLLHFETIGRHKQTQ